VEHFERLAEAQDSLDAAAMATVCDAFMATLAIIDPDARLSPADRSAVLLKIFGLAKSNPEACATELRVLTVGQLSPLV
jgi:hypothetical protein